MYLAEDDLKPYRRLPWSCPHLGNNLRAIKCEMIKELLGKLSGRLTPNTRLVPFSFVIGNSLVVATSFGTSHASTAFA